MELSIGIFDIVIIVIYLVGIVTLGCWAGWRQKRSSDGSSYFLAGRSLTWPMIGLALFGTNISSNELISFAQEGYRSGLLYGNLESMAALTLVILAVFFIPFYIRARVTTLPEFLEKRYNRACRIWLVVIAIVTAVFIHIGFALYTAAVVFKGLFGIDITLAIVIIVGLTGLYTIIGGLKAVVLTEAIQTVVLVTGSVVITAIGYYHVGGWDGLTANVEPGKLTLLRSSADAPDMSWYALLLGYPVIGIWYFCTDQTIVQRVLAAKDIQHAQMGALFTGFIKLFALFIFVLPGTICYALIRQGKLPDELTDSAQVYTFMVSHILPAGLKGIVIAALLAALMSTVSGALNSIATVFSYDIYKKWRPNATDQTLVFVGRIATLTAMVAAILWAPFISRFGSILEGQTTMISYIAPSITAVFLWGVLWKRASADGAFITLCGGGSLGFVVFLLDWYSESTGWNISFMMASFYLFLICSAILVGASLLKPQRHTKVSENLVWRHPLEALKTPAWKGLGNYKFVSALLLAATVLIYIIFS